MIQYHPEAVSIPCQEPYKDGACRAAAQLEHLVRFWPFDRLSLLVCGRILGTDLLTYRAQERSCFSRAAELAAVLQALRWRHSFRCRRACTLTACHKAPDYVWSRIRDYTGGA